MLSRTPFKRSSQANLVMNVKHIELDITVDPEKSSIYGRGTLSIENGHELLQLHLNSSLHWKKLSVICESEEIEVKDIEEELSIDGFLQGTKKWRIIINDSISQKKSFQVAFEYSGQIQPDKWGTNYITPDGVELACNVAWYPIASLDDKPTFQVRLKESKGWIWIMNAPNYSNDEEICWKSKPNPIDLTLIGLPSDQAIPNQNTHLFWGAKRNYGNFKSLEVDLLNFRGILEEWLGQSSESSFRVVLAPRNSGGIYVRRGLLITQDNLPEEYFNEKRALLLTSWAHELGHLWFNKTSINSYHNWLDEALADYCALLVTERKYGQEFFKERLNRVMVQIQDAGELPAIKTITRSHPKAELVFYKWGSIILHDIRKIIGLELFKEVLRAFAQKCNETNEIKTNDFITSIESVTGKEWTAFLDQKLSIDPKC